MFATTEYLILTSDSRPAASSSMIPELMISGLIGKCVFKGDGIRCISRSLYVNIGQEFNDKSAYEINLIRYKIPIFVKLAYIFIIFEINIDLWRYVNILYHKSLLFFFIKLPSVSLAQVKYSEGVVSTAYLANFKAVSKSPLKYNHLFNNHP